MAYHPRVEELSDSDPDEVDISTIAAQAQGQFRANNPSLVQGSQIPTQFAPPGQQAVTRETSKHWQCLYPLYFDATRSRAEGRRVSSELAVKNPLAREIADAVFSLNMQLAIEPEKTHPKDWANPGRIRVLVKEDGKAVGRSAKNKHDLYIKVAKYLQTHPTNETSPLRMRVAGLPPQTEPPAAPAVPRGWKMNTILPLHSAAISGGGVSDNLFKDMMAQMGGGEPEQGGGGGGKVKKEKRVKG